MINNIHNAFVRSSSKRKPLGNDNYFSYLMHDDKIIFKYFFLNLNLNFYCMECDFIQLCTKF